MSNARIVVFVVCSLAVSACTRTDNTPVTTYKPAESGSVADSIFAGGIATHGNIENAVSGYTSRQMGTDHFEIKASGTTATPSQHVEAIAHLRAAEIARAHQSSTFIITKERTGVECARKGGALIGARPFKVIEIRLPRQTDPTTFKNEPMNAQSVETDARAVLSATDASDEAKAATGKTNMQGCRTR